MKCEQCKNPIKELKEDADGEPINPDIPWEQYLCEICYDKIWDNLFNEHCPECRTHPCEHGGDCWINPWPHIMYLCYVAPRIDALGLQLQLEIL